LQFLKQFAPTAQVSNTENSQVKNTDTVTHVEDQPEDQPDEFRQTVFGEFQAKNVAYSSNDLQQLFRK